MIKNWLSFNESYDQSLINFNRDEYRAFSTYLKQDVMSYFSKVNKQHSPRKKINFFLSLNCL